MEERLLDKAMRFAKVKHKGTYRKGDNQPYIFHPIEVLSIASKMTKDEDILCAALLHDTVEDAGATKEEISEMFNDRIAELVADETENKRLGQDKKQTWKIRKEEAIEKVKNAKDIGAKMVCLADKVSNLRSFLSLYLMQGEDMWKNFNTSDPLLHFWYYNSLKEALVELKDYAPYKEYCFLLDALFNKYINKGDNYE